MELEEEGVVFGGAHAHTCWHCWRLSTGVEELGVSFLMTRRVVFKIAIRIEILSSYLNFVLVLVSCA